MQHLWLLLSPSTSLPGDDGSRLRYPETRLPPLTLARLLWWYSLFSCISLRRAPLRTEKTIEGELAWVVLPVIATVARLLRRKLVLENEYLRLENRIIKATIPGRTRFADEEHRPLTPISTALRRQAAEALSDDPSDSAPQRRKRLLRGRLAARLAASAAWRCRKHSGHARGAGNPSRLSFACSASE